MCKETFRLSGKVFIKQCLQHLIFLYCLHRIQYGCGHFRLGNLQTYCLLYEPNNFSLKVVVTQLEKQPAHKVKQKEAIKLFFQLMAHLEGSIQSVMKLYIPSAEHPVLHVCCPICVTPIPHIKVGCAKNISSNLSPLLCTREGQQQILPPTSYLPFGDTLEQQEVGK